MPGSPFEIQELVDRIIDILGCRTWTLLSCSLVARSWVNAAQSHLLQAPERTFSGTGYGLWDKNRLALRFYNTLHTFPHLIRHVRDLRMELIVDSSVTVETFGRICNLPFTHLRSVSIFVRKDLDTKGLQQLFSLPNLVSINLDTWIYHMYSFTTMWRRCSPSVRHLEIIAHIALQSSWDYEPAEPDCIPSVPIQLHSLQMVVWTEHRVDDSDLPHPDTYRWALYPFDLSHLKALSIRDDSGVPWAKFAIESIEVLDVFATPEEMAIDLSSFPNLSVLRVTPIETIPPMLLTTLSTIALSHRIKTIIMDTCPYNNSDFRELALGCKEDCAPLDLRLSTLSMSRPLAIEIEVRPEQETSKCAEVTECFPALVSRDMLRFRYRRGGDWWRELFQALPS